MTLLYQSLRFLYLRDVPVCSDISMGLRQKEVEFAADLNNHVTGCHSTFDFFWWNNFTNVTPASFAKRKLLRIV